jgi:hypothetical protein
MEVIVEEHAAAGGIYISTSPIATLPPMLYFSNSAFLESFSLTESGLGLDYLRHL